MTAVSFAAMATGTPLLVRATVTLPGLPLGTYAYVDPDDPYMAPLIRSRFLQPEEPEEDSPAEETGERTEDVVREDE